MRNYFVAWVVLLCLACGVSAQNANEPAKAASPLETDADGRRKEFCGGGREGGRGLLQRTLTDAAPFVAFDGQLYSRQDMLDQFGEGGVDLLPYDMKVVTAGDDVAIVTYNVVLRVPAAEDQGPPPRYQHFSTVWVKQGDAWKMKFQQMTASHWGDW